MQEGGISQAKLHNDTLITNYQDTAQTYFLFSKSGCYWRITVKLSNQFCEETLNSEHSYFTKVINKYIDIYI